MGVIEEIVDEPPQDPLHEGATVWVEGLQSHPQHNGVEGELLKLNADAGRWEVLLATGVAVKVKPANLVFVRPKPAFRFAPKRRAGSDTERAVEAGIEQLRVDGAGKAVSDELLQDAFEQVIGQLGPELRKQFGYVEDAKTVAEEAANERVDTAVFVLASVRAVRACVRACVRA